MTGQVQRWAGDDTYMYMVQAQSQAFIKYEHTFCALIFLKEKSGRAYAQAYIVL